MEEQADERIDTRLKEPLRERRPAQRSPRCHDVQHDDDRDAAEADDHGDGVGAVLAAEDDAGHLDAEPVGDDHRQMTDEEHDEGGEAQEVDAPRHLVAAQGA